MTRDFVGYGAEPPDPEWPGGARIAVNICLNFEGGGEHSMLEGDAASLRGPRAHGPASRTRGSRTAERRSAARLPPTTPNEATQTQPRTSGVSRARTAW